MEFWCSNLPLLRLYRFLAEYVLGAYTQSTFADYIHRVHSQSTYTEYVLCVSSTRHKACRTREAKTARKIQCTRELLAELPSRSPVSSAASSRLRRTYGRFVTDADLCNVRTCVRMYPCVRAWVHACVCSRLRDNIASGPCPPPPARLSPVLQFSVRRGYVCNRRRLMRYGRPRPHNGRPPDTLR